MADLDGSAVSQKICSDTSNRVLAIPMIDMTRKVSMTEMIEMMRKRKRPMRTMTVLALALGLVAMAVGGCAPKAEVPAPAAPQKVTVMLDWFPNTNHTGLYVAQQQGFYTGEGLDVTIVQPSEGTSPQLVSTGKADFAVSYQEEVTSARSEGLPVVALAAVIQHNTSGFASLVDKNIKTPRDFEGKTYGGWGSPAETAVLKALMVQHQADFSKIKMVNMGDADFFASMEKGIDFAWIFQAWTGVEAQLRDIPLNYISLKDENIVFDYYTPVLISSEARVAQNPQLVQKFMRATAQGYRFAIANPEQAAAILVEVVPELDPTLVSASQKYLAAQYQADAPRWGEMKAEVWKDYADFMFANGLIENNIDTQKAFTNDFLP